MQAEIESVILAFNKETKREEQLLIAFLSALAVQSASRKRMTYEMAQGVYDCIRLDADRSRDQDRALSEHA